MCGCCLGRDGKHADTAAPWWIFLGTGALRAAGAAGGVGRARMSEWMVDGWVGGDAWTFFFFACAPPREPNSFVKRYPRISCAACSMCVFLCALECMMYDVSSMMCVLCVLVAGGFSVVGGCLVGGEGSGGPVLVFLGVTPRRVR